MNDRRFVILDRDGTIIAEKNYLSDPAEVELLPGAAAALRRLRTMGFGLLVATNQSAIARGHFDAARLDAIHARMLELLASEGAQLDQICHCPHHPDDGCDCRKPATGMVDRASQQLGFDLAGSIVIGDNLCDIGLGRAIGATTILVRTGYGAKVEPAGADYVVDDLAAAAEFILSHETEYAAPIPGSKS